MQGSCWVAANSQAEALGYNSTAAMLQLSCYQSHAPEVCTGKRATQIKRPPPPPSFAAKLLCITACRLPVHAAPICHASPHSLVIKIGGVDVDGRRPRGPSSSLGRAAKALLAGAKRRHVALTRGDNCDQGAMGSCAAQDAMVQHAMAQHGLRFVAASRCCCWESWCDHLTSNLSKPRLAHPCLSVQACWDA